MFASIEAFVPILASLMYSNLYNATIELHYPWNGSFYFLSAGLTIIGILVTLFVHVTTSFGLKQLQSNDGEEESVPSCNLHPDEMDESSRRNEVVCISIKVIRL